MQDAKRCWRVLVDAGTRKMQGVRTQDTDAGHWTQATDENETRRDEVWCGGSEGAQHSSRRQALRSAVRSTDSLTP